MYLHYHWCLWFTLNILQSRPEKLHRVSLLIANTTWGQVVSKLSGTNYFSCWRKQEFNFTCSFSNAPYITSGWCEPQISSIRLGIIWLFQLFCFFGVHGLVCIGIYVEVLSFPCEFDPFFSLPFHYTGRAWESICESCLTWVWGVVENLSPRSLGASKIHHESASRNRCFILANGLKLWW